jgi:hypothetical protein
METLTLVEEDLGDWLVSSLSEVGRLAEHVSKVIARRERVD